MCNSIMLLGHWQGGGGGIVSEMGRTSTMASEMSCKSVTQFWSGKNLQVSINSHCRQLRSCFVSSSTNFCLLKEMTC